MVLVYLIIYSFSFSCLASLKGVQDKLYTNQFSKAKAVLDKVLSKDATNYQALFLYAQLYFSSDNKGYQIDSAYHYASLSVAHLPAEKDKNYIKGFRYGFSKTRIFQLKKDVTEAAYFSAEQANKIGSYNHFIEVYQDDYFKNLAIKHRDDLAFGEAKTKMDFISFKEFMDKYPSSNQATEARGLYEKLLFENTTKEGSWQAYKHYLDNYPEAVFREEALASYETLLFAEYELSKEPSKLYEFISLYPFNRYRNKAESLLFRSVCKDFNSQTLLNFIQNYSNSNSAHHIWQLIYGNETYADNDSIYSYFIQRFPFYPHKQQFCTDSTLASIKLYAFESNGLYGFKNKLTDSIVQLPIYYDVQEFSERLCAAASSPSVNNKYKYGFINKQFLFVVAPMYDEVYDFESGLSIVGVGDCPDGVCRYGIINEIGDTILPILYGDVHEFYDKLALVETVEKKIGYTNNAGNFIISPKFLRGRDFSENLAAVQLDTSWFFIDTNGIQKIPIFFKMVTDFKNGMSSFSKDGNLWGVLNNKGEIIKEAQFKEPVIFEDLVTKVKVEEKIEKKGKIKYSLIEYLLHIDGSMEKITD